MPTQAARLSAQDAAEYATLYARRNEIISELGSSSASISAGGNSQSVQRNAQALTAELRAITARMRELLGLPAEQTAVRRTSDLPDFLR
jgi:hypothetical protein